MNQLREQFKKATAPVSLTEQEKELGRHLLRAHMTRNGARRLADYMPRLALSFAIAVLCVGTLSYAAEQSTPGGSLYTIKTSMNERIRDILPGSPEANMEWEVTKQERRTAEAELMAAELGF